MIMKRNLLIVIMLAAFVPGCEKDPGTGGSQGNEGGRRQSLTLLEISELNAGEQSVNSHSGMMSRSTLTSIAGTYVQLGSDVTGETMPVYPRFTATDAGDYLMFYHYGNSSTWAGNECEVLRSSDLKNWGNYKKVFSVYPITDCTGASNKRAYAGAHPLLLRDGTILTVASTRAISNFRDRVADNGLSIRTSSDNGYSWSEETLILLGTNWEPMPVLLPSGRIQIYYTDSKKTDASVTVSSGSSYIYSDDNGKTWLPADPADHIEAFAQVRYTEGSKVILTDQMPAVIALNGSNKLAAAAESFIGGTDYTSYISLAYTDESGSWGEPDASGVLPVDRVNNFIKGCAPYLVQFPSGETVLSYNDGSVFYMRLGDENCRDFGPAIKVFQQTAATGKGFWGSLYCVDSHRMVAGLGGSGGVLQIGQFYLNHSIRAATHQVNVDGNNTEWKKTDETLYICSLGDTKATVRAAQDADNLYLLFEVADKDISKDDYVQAFFSDPSRNALGAGSIRVKASYAGLKTAGPYAGGWREGDTGAKVSASYDGTPSLNSDEDNGYVIEISIPKASLPVKEGGVLANFSLFDIKNGGEDAIIPTTKTSTDSWIMIYGL